MKILKDENLIFGKKTNLKSFNIKDKKNEENIFQIEKGINMLLILKLKLFEYKIITRSDISNHLADNDMNLDEYFNKLKISESIKNYFKDFYSCILIKFLQFFYVNLDHGDLDKFQNVDARYFLNNFRRGKEIYKMSKENKVMGNFKNSLHLKLNYTETEFSEILSKAAVNENGIYLNKNTIEPFILDNLVKNSNSSNKLIFCGKLNSIINILPDNMSKLKYDLNDLNLLVNSKRKYFYEFILKFSSNAEYEIYTKKINGYFYHFKEKNIYFIFDNLLFGTYIEGFGKKTSEDINIGSVDYKYYKFIVKSEKEYDVEEIIKLFENIFSYKISEKIILSNKFSNVSKIPDKGFYRKYVDLFYKYSEMNIFLFFSDIYNFNLNNLMIEEYLVSEAIINLINNKN